MAQNSSDHSMSDEAAPIRNLALQAIIRPALKQVRTVDKASADHLISAFEAAEDAIPGITQEILEGILRSEGFSMNISEILLRCSSANSEDFEIEREEVEFRKLGRKAQELKTILGKIPKEIQDRSKFLQTIKDIASAIKDLLDSVNEVLKTYQAQGKMREYRKTLEQNKREFVKYSKSFSDTLKQYFKDGRQESVFVSANKLINQTNNILVVFKMVGGTV
eukprot:Seg582.18 transcript_id=Seg582.18/GoldUCD/mRNA.D3Y31 product="Programmed cell death protein 10" protein_id=Seg582.18/GoldUCD/D3Y31